MSIAQSSSSLRSVTKGGVIQAGVPVTGFFGPFSPELAPGKKNRSRTEIRGVVLSSHSEKSWLVHWLPIGKNASIPFNKLKVVKDADPVSGELVSQMLKENRSIYIGGPDQLRSYIDAYIFYWQICYSITQEESCFCHHRCRKEG